MRRPPAGGTAPGRRVGARPRRSALSASGAGVGSVGFTRIRRAPGAGACACPPIQRSGSAALRWTYSCTSGWGRIRNCSVASPAITASATASGSITPWVSTTPPAVPALAASFRRSVLTPWGQRHDTVDAVVAVGDGEPLGQRDRGVLRDAVGGVADVGEQPGRRRGGEDVALAPRQHPGQAPRCTACTWAITLTSQICCHELRRRFDALHRADAGVAHEQVDRGRSAPRWRGWLRWSRPRGPRRGRAPGLRRRAARRRPGSASRVAVDDGHARRALGREALAQRAADAVGPAGDEHDLACDLHG